MRIRSFIAAAAGSLALIGAGQAGAVSVVGATRVVVTNAIPTWLQVAEVEAIEFGTLANVASQASGGVATASSVYGAGYLATNANDGNTAGSMFHSGSPDGSQFLQVLLGHTSTLTRLNLWGSTEGFNHRDLYTVTIYNGANEVLYSGNLDSRADRLSFVTFDDPISVGDGVPEPATWAMMILGFGAVGSMVRTRRRTALA